MGRMGLHLHRHLMGKGKEESEGVPKFCQCAGDMCLLWVCERMAPEFWEPDEKLILTTTVVSPHCIGKRLLAMGLQPRSIPCPGYGSEQPSVPMVHVWAGLWGEALVLGWAKLHSFNPHFGLRWSISGSSAKVPNLRCVLPKHSKSFKASRLYCDV